MAKRIVLLASGAGSLARAVLDADLDIAIVKVISERPAPVLDVAQSLGFATELVEFSAFQDRTEWGVAMETAVAAAHPDLVVSVGFMRILPATFVDRFRTINTHPALLPKFPGAHAVRDALAAGESKTGTTVHWVDAGVDTGTVIAQRVVAVEAGDTEESLHERIKIQERQLIVETLKHFSLGQLGEL